MNLKSVSKATFKDVIRYRGTALLQFQKLIKNDKPIYLGATKLEVRKLYMYDAFNNVLKPSLKDLQLHYMEADSFIIIYIEGKFPDKYVDSLRLEY